jgi:DNA segregation ATPase FtsK/SpoIIIE-like protein
MPEPSAEKPIEIEFSEADPHETQEIEPVELQSLDTDRHADEMMFDSDEASEAAKGSVTLASARHEINSETDVIVMDDAFQSELPFDVEPPILYKSERAESAAPDEETEIEETMDESEQSPEVSEEEPATVPETEVTSDNSESEVVLNAVAEGEATEDAPALGKPMATETKTRSDDWAAWMTDDASTEPRTGIAKPTYPSAAASTGAPLSAVEPEGLEGYHGAVAVVLERDQCSVSLLQRELGISFGAAAAAVEQMEKDRIVGPYQGSGHREVLMTTDTWRARLR